MNDRTGVSRVVSDGSVWMIDNDLRRYCRFPKQETPRERAEWSDERAGALQDAIWHQFEGEWRITRNHHLIIEIVQNPTNGTWFVARAPGAKEMIDTAGASVVSKPNGGQK